jgi:hypothetical protein
MRQRGWRRPLTGICEDQPRVPPSPLGIDPTPVHAALSEPYGPGTSQNAPQDPCCVGGMSCALDCESRGERRRDRPRQPLRGVRLAPAGYRIPPRSATIHGGRGFRRGRPHILITGSSDKSLPGPNTKPTPPKPNPNRPRTNAPQNKPLDTKRLRYGRGVFLGGAAGFDGGCWRSGPVGCVQTHAARVGGTPERPSANGLTPRIWWRCSPPSSKPLMLPDM